MKGFRANQLVVYQNGDSFEIGKVKRLCDDGAHAFVYYHEGDTAEKTHLSNLHPIRNAFVITETSLGGEQHGS